MHPSYKSSLEGRGWCCKNMKGVLGGGRCSYNTIINPLTNRKVSIYSQVGKKILNNYVENLDF